mmetsp:Transcript_28390/g.25116  ORF Transcript_28390/g.25116 Transcript_28390/m.25116 type:complete len:89 (-) Transcript_28390:274-540(-)
MEKMDQLEEGQEIAPAELSPEDIEKEGWLYKESRFWKVWRKRWCVLSKKGAKVEGRSMPAQNSWLFTFDSEGWQSEGKPPTERICMGQ